VATAAFHPRNSRIILATLTCNEIVLVDLRAGESGKRTVLQDITETEADEEEKMEEEQGAKRKK
jgi:COMPASS component SWD1